LEIQARIPVALAAIHNFISIHNPHDQPISSMASGSGVQMYDDDVELGALGPNDSDLHRDMIAEKMWQDYIGICAERGVDMDAAIKSNLDDDGDDDNIEEEDY
ncbi:hypothetical protein BYT27DRAFT_7089876, partial [Phlegmacium glaucopus]